MSGSRAKPGPLGPFVDGYRAWLLGRGYSPSVVVRFLITLGHLGRWLERNAPAVDQLTAKAMSSFLAEYRVDRARLPGASVWPLLEYLRAEGAVPPEPPTVVAPVEHLVGEYREWSASVAWRRSRSAPASSSRGGFSLDASTRGIRAACWGSQPAS